MGLFSLSSFGAEYRIRSALLVAGLPICFLWIAWSATDELDRTHHVRSIAELRVALSRIQPGETILLAPGTYEVSTPIVLSVDNITLEGAGDATVLRLADGANCPVVFVGLDEPSPSRFVLGVQVRRLHIDGNRENQTSEHWRPPGPGGWFTNNGITFRQTKDCIAEDISVRRAVSGGVVFALVCENMQLRRITSWDNAFDGIAWDGTVRNSVITDCLSYQNGFAGISWDLDVKGNVMRNTVSRDNKTSGLFARASSRNTIESSSFIRNEDGVFIADGEELKGGRGSVKNLFRDCTITENLRTGIWQAGRKSTGNKVLSSEVHSNGYLDTDNSFSRAAPIITSRD
jgi:hypothetical protein